MERLSIYDDRDPDPPYAVIVRDAAGLRIEEVREALRAETEGWLAHGHFVVDGGRPRLSLPGEADFLPALAAELRRSFRLMADYTTG